MSRPEFRFRDRNGRFLSRGDRVLVRSQLHTATCGRGGYGYFLGPVDTDRIRILVQLDHVRQPFACWTENLEITGSWLVLKRSGLVAKDADVTGP